MFSDIPQIEVKNVVSKRKLLFVQFPPKSDIKLTSLHSSPLWLSTSHQQNHYVPSQWLSPTVWEPLVQPKCLNASRALNFSTLIWTLETVWNFGATNVLLWLLLLWLWFLLTCLWHSVYLSKGLLSLYGLYTDPFYYIKQWYNGNS